MIALLLALACSPSQDGAADTGVDLGDDAPTLTLPDISDVDMAAAYVEAVQLAGTINLDTAWTGHRASLGRAQPGCPDIFVGPVEDADIDDDTDNVTWQDYCNQGGAAFGGWVSWDGTIQASGDVDSAEGRTVDASRVLLGDGLVATTEGAAFEFHGEASETVYKVESADYTRWTWSSLVEGSVSGVDAFGAADSTGWRTDLYMAAAGGDVPALELRGNAFLYNPRIADRFDSFAADLAFGTDLNCELEPRGWIGLRDTDAFWYDLVFLPLSDEGDPDPDYSQCDGCGTLYIRGVETVEYGQICPDFGDSWQLSDDQLPDLGSFLLTLREVLALEGS